MPGRIPVHRSTTVPSAKVGRAAYERQRRRREDIEWYQSPAWRSCRALKLLQDPLCGRCLARGEVRPATMVHHREERKARPDLALDLGNLESLCNPCHSGHHAGTRRPSRP